MEKVADSRVSGEKLVITTSQRHPNTAQGFSSEARTRGGPIPPLWPGVFGDPLGSGPGTALRVHPGEMREAGLSPLLVRDAVLEAAGRLLSELVGHLVAHDAASLCAGTHRTVTLLPRATFVQIRPGKDLPSLQTYGSTVSPCRVPTAALIGVVSADPSSRGSPLGPLRSLVGRRDAVRTWPGDDPGEACRRQTALSR